MKRKIYKTKIYIPSESYIIRDNDLNELVHATEMEVCVTPNYKFTYATDIITGMKIPIGKKVYHYDIDELTDIATSYLDKKGNPLGYFIIGRENKIDLGMISINKQFLEEALEASDIDIIKYRRKHPNKEEYKKTQQSIFEGFNDRVLTIQEQKKMIKKK